MPVKTEVFFPGGIDTSLETFLLLFRYTGPCIVLQVALQAVEMVDTCGQLWVGSAANSDYYFLSGLLHCRIPLCRCIFYLPLTSTILGLTTDFLITYFCVCMGALPMNVCASVMCLLPLEAKKHHPNSGTRVQMAVSLCVSTEIELRFSGRAGSTPDCYWSLFLQALDSQPKPGDDLLQCSLHFVFVCFVGFFN